MNVWKWILSAFLAGALAGAGTVALMEWVEVEAPEFEPYVAPQGEGWSDMEAETQRLLARIGEQREQIERLEAQLAATATVEAQSANPEQETVEQVREARREEMRARMEERRIRQVDDLVATYGLSDAQRQLLEQVFEQQREYYRARRSGETVEPFSFDAALESIMTDDQYAQYIEDTQEEIYNRAELMATTQLVRLSQQLELLPEQQDVIYDALHYTAQEAMIARQAGEDYNMREVLNDRLSTVLTPEQLETFRSTSILERTGRPPVPGP